MTDTKIVAVIEQESVGVKLSSGEYEVKPLTVRRLAKLAAILKDVQGDPKRFKDMESPDFHKAVAEVLIAAGDNMPKALALFAGDEGFEKLDDISLLDLSIIVLAAAQANKTSFLKETFQKAMEIFSGKTNRK